MRFLFAMFLAAFFFSSQTAMAAPTSIIAGDPCDSFGSTTMASNGQDLVACLKSANGTDYVWKSMTSPSSLSTAGTVGYFAMGACPAGWIEANGQSTASYPKLAAVVGATVPELRGEFIRGWDNDRGIDAGRALGSAQGDAIRNITGSMLDQYMNGSAAIFENSPPTGAFYIGNRTKFENGHHTGSGAVIRDMAFDASLVVPTASENRPRNVALLVCIATGE